MTLLTQVSELQAKCDALSATKTQLEHQLNTERADHQATQDNLIDFRLKTERLGQQVIQQTVQLTDHQQHLASLEEKHANARDALEHFRTAVKEQREQEQRRHEQQVQQLQAEMRTLNQTLIVKQTDITQLNRDNASFVGDIAELRKRLRSHEASGADWVTKINEAKTVLPRYQSTLHDLEVLQSQHEQLAEQLERQLKKASELEITVAKVTTELSVKNELIEKLTRAR
jgi:chromosome segregation ATPase